MYVGNFFHINFIQNRRIRTIMLNIFDIKRDKEKNLLNQPLLKFLLVFFCKWCLPTFLIKGNKIKFQGQFSCDW